MHKLNREVTVEILVGLFMFVVLIALGTFTIVLSRDNLLKTSYEYDFVFNEISGLREGDNVFLRGMNVGRVQQTSLEEGSIRVHVTLDVPITLRHGYSVEVVQSSMLGGKNLKIYEGPVNAQVLGENVTILGQAPVNIIEELGHAISGLRTMIDEVGSGQGTLGRLLNDSTMYDNLVVVSEDLRSMVSRIERGEGSLGRLLAEDDTLYEDIAETASSLRKVAESLEQGNGTVGKLIQDETVYDDLQKALAEFRQIAENLGNGQGVLGKLMAEDDTVYADLQASLAAFRNISEGISAGEGTLGKLIRDDRLYDEATMLVEDVRAAVDDLREVSPITSFGSVFFGAF